MANRQSAVAVAAADVDNGVWTPNRSETAERTKHAEAAVRVRDECAASEERGI